MLVDSRRLVCEPRSCAAPAWCTASPTRRASARRRGARCGTSSGASFRCWLEAAASARLFVAAAFAILLDGLGHALRGGGEKGSAVLPHPLHRALGPGVRVLEARHHVARDQVEAPVRRFTVRPVVRGDEEGAEA